MENPLEDYSVLMSVYNKEKPVYLKTSIQSMLNQTVLTNDFVIVCDGPLTGEVDEVVRDFEKKYPDMIHVVRLKKNVGLGRALNAGLRHCKNELVARMDSDDVSLPQRCEEELRIFEAMDLDIVGGTVQEFEKSTENITSNRVLPENTEDIFKFSKKRNPFNHPAVMFRKSKVEEAGGYREFPYFEDYDLWVRMLKNGAKGYNIKQPVMYMRAGSGMYARRGGIGYVKCIWRFKRHLRRIGYTSRLEFLSSTVPHMIVGIMPNGLRELVYKKVLRK